MLDNCNHAVELVCDLGKTSCPFCAVADIEMAVIIGEAHCSVFYFCCKFESLGRDGNGPAHRPSFSSFRPGYWPYREFCKPPDPGLAHLHPCFWV